jgi:hypothetical protein
VKKQAIANLLGCDYWSIILAGELSKSSLFEIATECHYIANPDVSEQ